MCAACEGDPADLTQSRNNTRSLGEKKGFDAADDESLITSTVLPHSLNVLN